MKKIIALSLLVAASFAVNAQTKADIFDGKTEITWLGIDFSELNFIGDAAQWQDAGQITNSQLKEKYFVGWNELIVAEKDKYDVAGAMRRKKVTYALDVTAAANDASDKDHFDHSTSDFRHLQEADINKMVKNYNMEGKSGIGMTLIVEGMHKEAKKASMWAVFINMSNNEVLLAKRIEGKAGGFGFRNYWAKTIFFGLRAVKDNYGKWKKGK